MMVFTVLLLVAAASATAIQPIETVHETAHVIPEMKLFNIFSVPKFNRDFILPHEKFGVKGLYEKPFIVAVKNEDKNTISAFLLRGGLSSLYNYPEFEFLRNMLLTGSTKVGIMLSGARYLDLPEMSMPVESIIVPHDFTLGTQFRMNQDGLVMPWLFITAKDDLRLGSLDKLMEIGLFSITNDKVSIVRDLVFEDKPEFSSRFLFPYNEDLEQQRFEHEDKFLPIQQRFAKPVYRILGEQPVKYNYLPLGYQQRVIPYQSIDTVRHNNPLVYPTYTPIVY